MRNVGKNCYYVITRILIIIVDIILKLPGGLTWYLYICRTILQYVRTILQIRQRYMSGDCTVAARHLLRVNPLASCMAVRHGHFTTTSRDEVIVQMSDSQMLHIHHHTSQAWCRPRSSASVKISEHPSKPAKASRPDRTSSSKKAVDGPTACLR